MRSLFLTLAIAAGVIMAADESASAQAAAPQPNYDSLAQIVHPVRNKTDQFVTLETTMGKMVLELFHDVAPGHADSFLSLTKKHFYDSTKFHRVVKGFMIQGGDPQGTGVGGAGYKLQAEFSDLPHLEGTLSMARGPNVNSASSQFFVCLAAAPHLNGQYTVFGHLIKGYDTLHKIGNSRVVADTNTGAMSRPFPDIVLVKAYVSDAAGNPVK